MSIVEVSGNTPDQVPSPGLGPVTGIEDAEVPSRLLVVDDESEILEEMVEYLEEKGFDCVTAGNGREAVESIVNDLQVGVVVTDIRMPEMDGLELLRTLRSESFGDRLMEIIILTGHAGRDEAIEALQNGASDFLTKPVSLKHLAHTCRRAQDAVCTKVRERLYKVNLEESLAEEVRLSKLQREFVSMMSHEFRTPLAIIDNSAQRLIRKAGRLVEEEIVEKSKKIRRAVNRMTELIDTTLYSSRVEAGKIECQFDRCEIQNLIKIVAGRQQEISPHHRIALNLDDLPERIQADAKLLDQVFTNLLSNAVKYAPDAPEIEVTGKAMDGQVAISVHDHGVGIPAEDLTRLFERYFRASTSTGIPGTGIGLNLAKHFVELHGGSLSADSGEGGTVFTVVLPTCQLDMNRPDADCMSPVPFSAGES